MDKRPFSYKDGFSDPGQHTLCTPGYSCRLWALQPLRPINIPSYHFEVELSLHFYFPPLTFFYTHLALLCAIPQTFNPPGVTAAAGKAVENPRPISSEYLHEFESPKHRERSYVTV